MTGALVAGLVAGYGIAVPVGAVGTYLVSLTARTSLRTGACAALGVATADGLYALVAVVGGTALTPVLQPELAPLRWISALVLAALAVRGGAGALRRYRSPDAAPAARSASLFVLAAFAASASWQLALAGSGALLGRALTGRRGRLVTALVSSAVIAALAARMLVPPG
ncbi:lysine transporter LysE [Streptomyces hygroscopicus]|uniref:LysE family transporter n=1 Tax=Streptomyces hygroscopicus TaxID=1912 RepID=UPI00223F65DE|nr:LysE family transporter [Streptomyces hygroscopicus]MCW7947543.1 lysine transporter LysE [Streptomyces hygroscopicus]